MEYGLVFAALSSIALGLFHLPPIWRRVFRPWREVDRLHPLNRALIDTLLVALALTLTILGVLTLLIRDPAYGELQRGFLWLCAGFWLWRTLWQLAVFRYDRLRPGSALLALHLLLIAVFVTNTAAYVVTAMATLRS